MIKRFFLPLFVFFSLATFAQKGSASPYSFYGIGEFKFIGLAENRLMGGVGVFSDSIHINVQNPASYSSLKLTTFSIGGTLSYSKFTSYEDTEKAQRATLDYFTIGLPIGRQVGVAFGLMPYTTVGYSIRTEDSFNNIAKYNGRGGVNRAFVGASYKINANFSAGFDFAYNFGRIATTTIVKLDDIQYGTEEFNDSDLAGYSVNLGLMYKRKLKNKYDFFGSMTYSPQTNMKLENARNFSTIQYVEDFTPGIIELLDTQHTVETIKMPSRFTLGAGFGKERKWLVGAEVTFQQSNTLGNRYDDITDATFENGVKYSFGGYYVPNYASFSNYFNKVTYRAGFRYEDTGMIINNEKIKDYAFTGGFGFPLGGTFSNLNIGVEYGRKGTAKANLVEENYTNLVISFSLNDQWFVKRKFD